IILARPMLLLRLLARARGEHDYAAFAPEYVGRETNLANLVWRRLHQPSGALHPRFRQEWRVVASPRAFRCGKLCRKRCRLPSVPELENLGSLPFPGMEFGAQRSDIALEQRLLFAGHMMQIFM